MKRAIRERMEADIKAGIRTGGYPKRMPDGRWALIDGRGKILGYGHVIGCKKIQPGAPGSWLSNERCSYRFVIGSATYSCRGYGEGMSAGCRRMKKLPRSPWWEYNRVARGEPARPLAGARKRRRRQR
jgi:hypothetical protein